MNGIPFVVGVIVCMASLFGYMMFFHEKFRVDPSFTPILTVSSVSILIYILGFVLPLSAASLIMYVLGLICIARAIVLTIKKKYDPRAFAVSPGIIVFSLFCLFMILRTRGLVLLHVDNFSHWSTIVKDMSMTDAYPKITGAVICRNYTPGSSVFLYHVCRMTNFSEANAVMAQGIIVAATAAPLFCKLKISRPLPCLAICCVFIGVVVVYSLNASSLGIYNLLVDGLIAYFTTACGVIVYFYRRDMLRCAFVLAPVTIMLSLIKSSAQIFSAMVILLAFILLFKKYFSGENSSVKRKLTLVGVFGGIFAANLLLVSVWSKYADIAFNGYENKFPSGAGELVSSLVPKDASYLKQIASDMLAELSDFSSNSMKLLLFSIITASVVILITALLKGKVKFILGVCVCCLSVGIFYALELYVLYAFIFPPEEALILASFYRYFSTGSILLSTVLLTASVYALQDIKLGGKGKWATCAVVSLFTVAIAAGALISVRSDIPMLFDPYATEEVKEYRNRREELTAFYDEVKETVQPNSYIVVYTEKTDFYTSIFPHYELMTTHHWFLYPSTFNDAETLEYRLNYPQYFIVESGSDNFRRLLEERGYTFVGGESAVYELDREKLILTAK